MKKLTAIICVIAMLLSLGVTSGASEFDFLGMEVTNYDATVDYGVEVNKPLDFLSALNEEAGFDVQYFVQELLKSEITADVACDISEDLLKAKMYMSGNVKLPINISEDLKIGADVTLSMWMEYDFSSAENAKLMVIIKNPLDGKYMYMDLFDEAITQEAPEMKEEIINIFAQLDLGKYYEDVIAAAKNNYEKHATVTTDGDYTVVSFTNDSLIDFFVDYCVDVLETDYMKNAMAMESGTEVIGFTADEMSIAMAKATIKSLGIFAKEDAFVIKSKLNKNGVLESMEEKLHIQFNIGTLAETLGLTEYDIYPLTKENSDIDITLVTNAMYNKIGDAVVEMPALTEENSTSLIEMMMGDYYLEDDYYYDEDYYVELETYQPAEFWDYAQGTTGRGGMYVDMEEFIDSASWDEDNLTGTVALDGDNVVIALTSDNFGTVTVNGSLKDDAYTLNEMQLWGRRPFMVVEEYNWDTYDTDKKVYVNVDVLNYILGCKVESITTYLIDDNGITLTNPEYYFNLVRPNPAYVEPVEEEISFDEAASIGIIGGADGPTSIFVTE